MEPIKRPVMDIRPQRNTMRPLPRADFAAATPAAPAPAPSPFDQPTPAPVPDQPPVPQLPKTKAPIAAILLAVLIGGSLIAVAVFGYLKSQDKQNVAATPAATVQKATATDVDTTLNDTDAQLKQLDDAADFSGASLSDDSLGL